jgi:excisionase family DNA binding protein
LSGEAVVSAVREQTVLPSQDVELLEAAQAVLAGDEPVALTGVSGKSVQLPSELRGLLATVVTAMRRGQAVTLAPLSQRLTTQEAADLLGISRPTLIKLLDAGKIPYETPSRHRRIRLSDLLAFQALRREDQRRVLRELTQDAQELGLYDASPEEFEAALAEGRAKHA